MPGIFLSTIYPFKIDTTVFSKKLTCSLSNYIRLVTLFVSVLYNTLQWLESSDVSYEVSLKRVLIWQELWGRPGKLSVPSERNSDAVPARVFSDRAGQWQAQLWLGRQTHTHKCLQYTQLPPGRITKVSWQKQFGCLKYGLHTILRLYFTSSFSNTQACFYGIWSTLLNNLIVHCWPDSTFPDLDYKRKTASGKFSGRSMDAYSIIPSPY